MLVWKDVCEMKFISFCQDSKYMNNTNFILFNAGLFYRSVFIKVMKTLIKNKKQK